MKEIIAALFFTFALAYTDINYYYGPQQFISPVAKATEKTPYKKEIDKIEAYLKKHNSPLIGHAKTFVDVSYENGLEPELLVSISGVESTFGKHTPSCAGFNPFGWSSATSPCGFYRFGGFDEAIEYVAGKIATSHYYADFREERTVEALAQNYNNGSQKWTEDVKYFLYEIKSK